MRALFVVLIAASMSVQCSSGEELMQASEYLKKTARNFGSILIGIETRSPENFPRLMESFDQAGLGYEDITENEILANLII